MSDEDKAGLTEGQAEPQDEEALSTEGEGTPGDGESWKRETTERSVISDASTGDVPDPQKVAAREADLADEDDGA